MSSLKNILDHSFIRNLLTLLSSSAVAQVISIASIPFLTRMYTPSAFGFYAIFTAFSVILSIPANGRYELSIMLPKEDKDSDNLLFGSILIATAYSILLLIIFFLLKNHISGIAKTQETVWPIFIPITIFLESTMQSFSYWHNRKKNYGVLAKKRIIEKLFSIGISILFFYSGHFAYGLVFGYFAGLLSSVLYLAYVAFRKKLNIQSFDYKLFKQLLKRYRDFPQKSMLGELLKVSVKHTPIFIIGPLFGQSTLGIYNIVTRVFEVPQTFFANIFSQIYYQYISHESEIDLSKIYSKTCIILISLITIPMLIFIPFRESLFGFVFGSKWAQAGQLFAILIPFCIIQFVYNSQRYITAYKRRMDFDIKYNAILLIMQTLSLLAGFYFFNSFTYSLYFISISGSAIFSYNLLWMYRIVSTKEVRTAVS